MSIAASVSAAEINAQVQSFYVNKYFESYLIYAPSANYQPGITVDSTFLAFEVAYGTGGYKRQVLQYVSGDVGTYADDGVALATKAAVYAHDGGATTLDFSHVALVGGNGNVITFGANTAKPSSAVNGSYLDLPTTTAGSGKGLTVNVAVANAGAALGDYVVTVATPGYGYAVSDVVQINNADLLTSGLTTGTGNLVFSVATVYTSTQRVLAVAKTANTVQLSAGNEAAFYWNLKQYGYA